MELYSPSINLHPVSFRLSLSLSRHVLFFSFIALAWQSAHSKKGGVGGRWWEGLREGGGGVVEEKGGERICGLCSSWLKQSLYYVKAVGAGSGWEEGGEENGVGCQLLTRSTRPTLIGSSAPFSAVLSGSLKVEAQPRGCRSCLCFVFFVVFFLSANGGDDCAPQLRHKLIREIEEVAGGRIVRSLRLPLY